MDLNAAAAAVSIDYGRGRGAAIIEVTGDNACHF